MSDQSSEQAPKQYAYAHGIVQTFVKDGVRQPAVRRADLTAGTVYNFTIKTPNGNYVDIALWAEYHHIAEHIREGYVVDADGTLVQTPKQNGQGYWSKITPYRLAVVPCVERKERPIVNQQPVQQAPPQQQQFDQPQQVQQQVVQQAPAPQAPPPEPVQQAPAPAASPFNTF